MAHPLNSESEQSSRSSNSVPSSTPPAGLQFYFLSLFPEIFQGVLDSSLLGKAQKKGLVSFQTVQIRDFATDKHRTVDDNPYGGGEGMLMKADVLHSAWKSVQAPGAGMASSGKTATLLLSPQGTRFTQEMARELATYSRLILVCGHYEGVDERFIECCVDREISIGDYILTGGELPALVLADTIARLVPGVVGNQRSLSEESLEKGLLKYPQYTRPREFEGLPVPDVLMGGDHGAVMKWREQQMRERTQRKRPDLWEAYCKQISVEEKAKGC